MKKFLSALITMALILSVSACGGNTTETTTTAAETTTSAENNDSVAEVGGADEGNTEVKEETEAEVTDAEVIEITTEETTAETTAETTVTEAAPEGELINNAFLDGLKDKSPLYYEFGKITSTVPVTMTMNYSEAATGTECSMKMCMASLSRIAIVTDMAGQSARIILDDGNYYIISDNEKYVLYYTLSDEEKLSMEEEMANSMQVSATFDFDKTEFTSGTEEFMGETLKFETVDDGTTKATIYFDPTTDRARYMVSQGQTVEIDDYYTGVDESLFEIPQDYEMMDFETFAGSLSEAG